MVAGSRNWWSQESIYWDRARESAGGQGGDDAFAPDRARAVRPVPPARPVANRVPIRVPTPSPPRALRVEPVPEPAATGTGGDRGYWGFATGHDRPEHPYWGYRGESARQVIPPRALLVSVLLAAAVVGGFLALRAFGGAPHTTLTMPLWDPHRFSQNWHDVFGAYRRTILNPAYFSFVALLICLERVWPAKPQLTGHKWTVGMAHDFTWMLFRTATDLTVVAFAAVLYASLWDHMTGGFDLNGVDVLGVVGASIVALVLADLCSFWSHLFMHFIPTLWAFHSVHHSQTELNVLTNNREHFVETIWSALWVFLPARLLGLDTAQAATLAFFAEYLATAIHANVRTDFGPLRFVLMSPQAHRVHHGNAPQYYNTNMAEVFPVWDYLFGFRYQDRHDYPDAGIDDVDFPMARSLHPFHLVGLWAAEIVYPFKVVYRRAKLSLRPPEIGP